MSGAPTPLASESRFVASVIFEGHVIAAARKGGLFRLEPDVAVPIQIGLTPAQRQITAMAVINRELWLGTGAGLLRLERTSCGYRIERELAAPILGMIRSPRGVEVVTVQRRYRLDDAGERLEPVWELAAGY